MPSGRPATPPPASAGSAGILNATAEMTNRGGSSRIGLRLKFSPSAARIAVTWETSIAPVCAEKPSTPYNTSATMNAGSAV